MKMLLRLPSHLTFEELVDAVADAGWRVLTLPPELHQLYPGYWVAVRHIVFTHLNQSRVGRAGPAEREIVLADDREEAEYAAALARAILRQLQGVHCGTCGVECVADHLPAALHGALRVYADAGDSIAPPVPPPAGGGTVTAVRPGGCAPA